jgi:uncharacterized protein
MLTKNIINKLINSIINHPLKYITSCLIISIFLIPHVLKIESDFGVRIWFRTTDPLIKDLNELERKFGNDEKVILAIHTNKGIFQKDKIELLQKITEDLWLVPQVLRVDSLVNYNYSISEGDDLITTPFFDEYEELTTDYISQRKALAQKDKIILNQFVSKDFKTSVVFGSIVPVLDGGSPKYRVIADEIKKITKKYQKQYPGVTFHSVGAASYNDAYREVSENDIKVMIPIDLMLMIFFLFFIFRRFEAVVIPTGLVAITIMMTFGTSGLLHFKYDNLSAAIPGILIAICMADSVHVLATFYRSLKGGATKEEAMRSSLHKNLVPTFLTSVSTMIGFFSLVSTELIPVQNLGILAGLGTFYAWMFTIFFCIPLLKFIPINQISLAKSKEVSPELTSRYIQWLNRHKNIIFYTFSALSIAALILGAQNKVNADPLKHFDKKLKISKDTNFLLNIFNGLGGPNVMVDSGKADGIKGPEFMEKVELFKSWVEELEVVNKVTSITATVKDLNQKLNNNDPSYNAIPDSKEKIAETLLIYTMGLPQGMGINDQVSVDNRFIKLVILWNLHDAETSLALIEKINMKAKEIGLDINVTGKIVLYHRMVNYIVSSFFRSIGLALILISIMLIIVLKSWRLGALSLLPNVVPLLFGLGLMTLASIYIDIGTSIVISVCLGIAVDDTIHFLSHYRNLLSSGLSPAKSLEKVFIHTAPALVFTTIILTVCFGCFIFANFVPNINFGILCSIILTFALLVDLVYLPSILLKFNVSK